MDYLIDFPTFGYVLLAICGAGCAFLTCTKRRAIQGRARLTLKRNVIEVEGGEIFAGSFSSESRLVVNREELRKVVHAVAGRRSHTRGRFASLREAAHVRICPGASGVTDLELEAVYQTLIEEFIDVEMEVAESPDDERSMDSTVRV